MNERLERVASLVEAGSELIDIGSDHGQLPLLLLERGIVSHVHVSDIAEGPLNNARETLMGHCASFYLCDGLPAEGSFDAAVIAGMGGRTISDILEKDWKRFQQMNYLILQPMQHIRELRAYLLARHFRVVGERVAFEGHYYVILKVIPGEDEPYDLDLGKECQEDTELYLDYLSWQRRRVESYLSHLSGEKEKETRDLLRRMQKRAEDMV